MQDQDPKAVHVIVEPAPISAGVDNDSLWTLLAIIFFGLIVFFFVTFNKNTESSPLNLDNAVEMQDADNDGIIDMGTTEPLNGVVGETPTSS